MFYEKQINHKQRKAHIEFIESTWEKLCVFSYESFLLYGRGMVLLFQDDINQKPMSQISCTYVHNKSEVFQNVFKGEWPGEKEAKWVNSYNPESSILIVFYMNNGDISSYNIAGLALRSPLNMFKLKTMNS